ncbi:MAG: glycoside hydrolase family 3 protein [Parvularculaceae bacterium]|nr:glycoside hydrolase family 3 protein [Parvularculaceae bacterium]
MAHHLATMFGCSGTTLTDWEKAFFRETRPWAYILFGRNIDIPEQVKALTAALREASNDPDAPIFVDQEGGTVARFKRPHFRHPPNPSAFAQHHEKDPEVAAEAAWLNARIMADDLKALGVNANCAPMLDVVDPNAHEFLQKRALGYDAETVTTLGKATALGLRDGGVAPVVKHAPGHGKGDADSHHNLPRVRATREQLIAEDFVPFQALKREAMMMTAHVIYEALDPDHPGTLSSAIINDVIRDDWGYDGLLMTDDINMNALGGTIEERTRSAIAAGCELICHCNGDLADMESVARGAGTLSGQAIIRADKARAITSATPKPFDRKEAAERLKALNLFEAPA